MANPLTDSDVEIALRINTVLTNKKVPVTTLSEQTGIADKTLRRSLSGGRSLTIRELDAISDALQVSPATLLPATHTGTAA
jgi:DNA-binding Xre family transcriptional regulator